MKDPRETLLKKVQMYAFAAHETALYLDGHPNNRQALSKFSEWTKLKNEAVAEYERTYGPLTIDSGVGNNGWDWIRGKWPWQNYEPMEDKR
ncbi:MAG: spore coat protein CotJB [Clostridia bacterium]|jgi:spore coat protein JB|nr:spore coat protein CotJB [Clostridia bacterium]